VALYKTFKIIEGYDLIDSAKLFTLSNVAVIFTEVYFQLTKTTLVCARITINKDWIYHIE